MNLILKLKNEIRIITATLITTLQMGQYDIIVKKIYSDHLTLFIVIATFPFLLQVLGFKSQSWLLPCRKFVGTCCIFGQYALGVLYLGSSSDEDFEAMKVFFLTIQGVGSLFPFKIS